MSDLVVARLRTAVPVVWGAVVAWLLTSLPAIPESVGAWLDGDAVRGAVITAVIMAWYAIWNKYSSKVPDWLVTIVLGSAKTPTYTTGTATEYVSDVTGEEMTHVVTDSGEMHVAK